MTPEDLEFEAADETLSSIFSMSDIVNIDDANIYKKDEKGNILWTTIMKLFNKFDFELTAYAYMPNNEKLGSGVKFWVDASSSCANKILEYNSLFHNRKVLELGCGSTGLPGLVAAASGSSSVDFLDIDPFSLNMMKRNLDVNYDRIVSYRGNLQFTYNLLSKSWADLIDLGFKYDVIIGSEIIYDAVSVEELVNTLNVILNKTNG
jgi:hypothetical protein